MPDLVPRLYASFAAFERDERARLGLDPLPEIVVASAPAPAGSGSAPTKRARASFAHVEISPAALRAEGVVEIGRAMGTSILYVLTRVKLHLLHVSWVPDRRLDDYAVELAMTWIEGHGLPSYEVASNLGVQEPTLRQALLASGHAQAIPAAHAAQVAVRTKGGNRRGRFLRRSSAFAAQ